MTYPTQSDPPMAAQRRRTGIVAVLVALVALLLVALAGVGFLLLHRSQPADKPAAATFTVVGTVTLNSGSANLDDKHCVGFQGFDDLRTGTQVVVTSPDGRTVGVGQLGDGLISGSGFFSTCSWAFNVTGVPGGLGYYGVEVSHRGRVQFTEAALRSVVHLTVG